jgi:hypothetical protein
MNTATSGGKTPGTTGARKFLQAVKPLFEEAFPPQTDDLSTRTQALSDFIVLLAFRSKENHFRTQDLKIWQRIFS